MKGKENLIGIIIGVVLTVLASLAGLQSNEIKAGICGVPAPTASVVPGK